MSIWPEVALSEVTECLDSKRVPVKESERVEGDVPYYGANGQQGWIERPIFNEPLVLVAEDGGHFADPSRGVAYKINGPSWVNNHAHVLRPRGEHLDVDFLRRVLENYDFGKYISGSTRAKLNQKQLNSATIPLPPLDEQRRIAAILDKADDLRAKRREAIAKLDTLAQSIFIEMFGDPVTNPMKWPVNTLGQIAEFYAGSTLPSGQQYIDQSGGYALCKVSDLNLEGNETYINRIRLWTDKSGAKSAIAPSQSIVIPKRGGAIGTNKKRIIGRPTILDPNLMGIRADGQNAEVGFLYQWFQFLDLADITSGSSVPQLNKKDLSPLRVSVPPRKLQELFDDRVSPVRNTFQIQVSARQYGDDLFASLQQRAFNGEL